METPKLKKNDVELIKRIAKNLQLSDEEAYQVWLDDKEIDRMPNGEVNNDLTPEQKKTIKDSTLTGSKNTPTVYNFTKRERKENTTKSELIAKLFEFLSENGAENAEIVNKEREISFKMGENTFSVTLTQHRKPKKVG